MSAVRCIAPRVSDVPGPEVSSAKCQCHSCGAEVWVPLAVFHSEPSPLVVCERCGPLRALFIATEAGGA